MSTFTAAPDIVNTLRSRCTCCCRQIASEKVKHIEKTTLSQLHGFFGSLLAFIWFQLCLRTRYQCRNKFRHICTEHEYITQYMPSYTISKAFCRYKRLCAVGRPRYPMGFVNSCTSISLVESRVTKHRSNNICLLDSLADRTSASVYYIFTSLLLNATHCRDAHNWDGVECCCGHTSNAHFSTTNETLV